MKKTFGLHGFYKKNQRFKGHSSKSLLTLLTLNSWTQLHPPPPNSRAGGGGGSDYFV